MVEDDDAAQAARMARQATELVVTGPWSAEMAEQVDRGVVTRLVLNYALGFDEPNLDFLRNLPIRELVILDRRLVSLDPIYTLAPTLELLHVTTDPGLDLDLSRLPNVRDLRADWSQVSNTITEATRLHRAAIGRYEPGDLFPLMPLPELATLSMKDEPRLRSLAGLPALPSLTHLGLHSAQQLEDISELKGRASLETLHLDGCRQLASIRDLDECTQLRRLSLAEGGELDSAAPIAGLVNLRYLHLHGTTQFLDGNLTPIAALPHLRELRMQNRRHYQPSVPAIQASLPRA